MYGWDRLATRGSVVTVNALSDARVLRLSVVAPCHNEEESLAEFHRRTAAAAAVAVGESYEIVLVDDGSTDATWAGIEALSATDPRVVGVRLMRNHGHQLAATAGLATARGARIMLIDADLQDPPELIADMMALMDRGADVVYGQRRSREGESWFKTYTAATFYRLLSRLANVRIPQDTGDFRLMSRRVLDVMLTMPERERFIRGMVSWIGGRQVPLLYERKARFAGTTKYNLPKMIRFATDAITSFSIGPLRLASWLGIVFAGVGGTAGARHAVSLAQGQRRTRLVEHHRRCRVLRRGAAHRARHHRRVPGTARQRGEGPAAVPDRYDQIGRQEPRGAGRVLAAYARRPGRCDGRDRGGARRACWRGKSAPAVSHN